MSKLHLTTVFHGNLGYSSIPWLKHKEVINKCYWPIISLVEKLEIKLGFEFPAQTLEMIKKLDGSLLQKIKHLWEEEKIEVVGSGYVQSIFPLIPAKANLKNLEFGNSVYKKLLGRVPRIALVNEQAYSKGLVQLYKEAGYKAIIIDWVNSLKSNDKLRECKFSSCKIKGTGNESIDVIWNNSILFQKLQRYVYGDMNLEDYINYIKSHNTSGEDRCLMIYGSDMEVFDFRPRDPKTLHSGEITEPEVEKIEEAFVNLKNLKEIKFILPSEVLNINFIDKVYNIGSSEYPIITKKQDKYNITRWAICGRENSRINSLCYRLFERIENIEMLNGKVPKKISPSDVDNLWLELTCLWGSDFRTHIIEEKYLNFKKRLDAALRLSEKNYKYLVKQVPIKKDDSFNTDSRRKIHIDPLSGLIKTPQVALVLSASKGGTIRELVFPKISEKSLMGELSLGYYDDISFSPDWYCGHVIIYDRYGHKFTDLIPTKIVYPDINKCPIRLPLKCRIDMSIGVLWKTYYVYMDRPRVDLEYHFNLKNLSPLSFRVGIATINPEGFNLDHLKYTTVNGGNIPEIYYLKGKTVRQDDPVSLGVSTRHCLGATEGWLDISDNKKGLAIITDKSGVYSVPLLHFEEVNKSFFLRVYNSISETDETTNTNFKGNYKISFTFLGHKNNLEEVLSFRPRGYRSA